MSDHGSKNFFSMRALTGFKRRRRPSSSTKRFTRRRRLAEQLESRRLLAVIGFDEAVDGDLGSDPAANVFTLDSTGTNTWTGTLESPADLADGFQLELAPGTSVTDIRLSFADADEGTDPDQDVRFNASPLFDHAVSGSESVSAGSFSTLNPTLPIQNTQFINQLLADVLIDATQVVPAGAWSIDIDTFDSNLPPEFLTTGNILTPENQADVVDLESLDDDDVEGAGLTYGISGGDDQTLFAIDSVTGQVSFVTAPDFESPSDLDSDNVYELTVDVTDSSMESATLALTITVEDVNENPFADAGGPYMIDAGQDLVLDASLSSDPDQGDSLLFQWDLDRDGTNDIVTSDPVTTVEWLTVIDLIQVGSQDIELTVRDSGGLESTALANVTISDRFVYSPESDGVADAYTLRIQSTDIQVISTADSTLLSRVPLAPIATIDIVGGDDNDELRVDFSGGEFGVPIDFDGGLPAAPDAGDSLVLTSGSASSVEHTFFTASSGSVVIGLGVSETITYDGLEPIIDNLSAVDRVFTFTGGSETIVLRDEDAGEDNGVQFIDSDFGESVAFLSPTDSLTIHAGTGEDLVTIQSLDPMAAFTALTVSGGEEDDEIVLEALASGVVADLNGDAGNDRIALGVTSLDAIQGSVNIAGGVNEMVPVTNESVTAKALSVSQNLLDGDFVQFNDSSSLVGETYTLTESTLERIGLGGTFSYLEVESIELSTGSSNDTVNVTNTLANVRTWISTNEGNDVLNVTTTGAQSVLVVDSGTGDDSLTISDTGAGENPGVDDGSITRIMTAEGLDEVTVSSTGIMSGLEIVTGDQADVVTIESTGADSATRVLLGAGEDVANVRASGLGSATDIFGGDDVDTFNVSSDAAGSVATPDAPVGGLLDGILGDLCFYGEDGEAGTDVSTIENKNIIYSQGFLIGDQLNISDASSMADETYSLDQSAFERMGLAGSVLFETIERLNITSGSGNDTVSIVSTAAASTTVFTTGAGADEVTVTTTGVASSLTMATGDGEDTINLLSSGQASLTAAQTGMDDDDVNVTSTGSETGLSMELGSGVDLFNLFSVGDFHSGSLAMDAGDDIFNVQSLPVSSGFTVLGNLGNDTFNVSSDASGNRLAPANNPSGMLDGILGCLTFDGGGQDLGQDDEMITARETIGGEETVVQSVETGDELNVSDESSLAAHLYTVAGDALERVGLGEIEYGGIESLHLEAGQGESEVNVLATADATAFRLDTFAGADIVTIDATGTGSISRIFTGSDADDVSVLSTGTVSATTIETGTANDLFAIQSVGDRAGLRVLTQDGEDAITIESEQNAPSRSGNAVLDLRTGSGEDEFTIEEVYLSTVVDLRGEGNDDRFVLSTSGADGNGNLVNLNHDPMGSEVVASTRQLFLDGGDNDLGGNLVRDGVNVISNNNAETETVNDIAIGDQVFLDISTSSEPVDLRYAITDESQAVLATTTPASEGLRELVGNEVFETLEIENTQIVGTPRDDFFTVSSGVAYGIGSTGQLVDFASGDGDDQFEIIGTDESDLITVGLIGGDLEPFQISGVEEVRVDGGAGSDEISVNTAARTALNGEAGDDDILGGTGTDLLTGGPGIDRLFGGNGDDVILTDRTIGSSEDFQAENEILSGGSQDSLSPGDVCIQVGLDQLVNCETIVDGGGIKDVLSWLRGIFISAEEAQVAIDDFETLETPPQDLDAVTEPSQIPNVPPANNGQGGNPRPSPLDVNRSGTVTSLDALQVINYLARMPLPNGEQGSFAVDLLKDVNGNGRVEPLDALLVINFLARSQQSPSGEGVGPWIGSVDDAFSDHSDNEEWLSDSMLF